MAEVKVVVRTIDQDSRQITDYNNKLSDVVGTVGKLSAGVVAAGAVFKQAFDLSKEGANINQLEDSFNLLNQQVLKTPNLLKDMQAASRGTVSDAQLMEGVLKLTAGTTESMSQQFAAAAPRLLEIAKASNKLNPTLGDTAFLYESISTGIKRQSPLILDNLGIVVKVGEANEKYAAAIGKTVTELTAEEKQTALLNATLESGNRLIEQVGGNVDSQADAWARLEVRVQEVTNAFKQHMAEGLLPWIALINGDYAKAIKDIEASNLEAAIATDDFTKAQTRNLDSQKAVIDAAATSSSTFDEFISKLREANAHIPDMGTAQAWYDLAIAARDSEAAVAELDERIAAHENIVRTNTPTVAALTEEERRLAEMFKLNAALSRDYKEASLEYEVTADMETEAEEKRAAAHEAAADAAAELAQKEAEITAQTAKFFNTLDKDTDLLAEYRDILGDTSTVTQGGAVNQELLNQKIFESIQANTDNATAIAIAGEALGIYTEEEANARLEAALLDEMIRRQVESWDGTREGVTEVKNAINAYINELNNIPSEINTKVSTNYVSTGEPPPSVGAGGQGRPGGKDSEFAMGGWTGAAGGIVHPNELVIPSSVLAGGMGAVNQFAQQSVPGGVSGGGASYNFGGITIVQQPGQNGQQLAQDLMNQIGRMTRQQMAGRG